jgi:hypothetical protein
VRVHAYVYVHVNVNVSVSDYGYVEGAGGRDAADVRRQSDAGVSARGTRGEEIRADGGGGWERAGAGR